MASARNIGFLALVASALLVGPVCARQDIDELTGLVGLLRGPGIAADDLIIEPFRRKEAQLMCDRFLQPPVRLDGEFCHDVPPASSVSNLACKGRVNSTRARRSFGARADRRITRCVAGQIKWGLWWSITPSHRRGVGK